MNDELEKLLAETQGLKNLKVKTYPAGDAGPRDRWIEAESLARVYNAADYVDEADAALIVAAVNALPELLERVKRYEDLIRVLLKNEPHDAVSEGGHIVLDLWLHDARAALKETGQ